MKARIKLLASLILVNSSFTVYYALPIVEERGIPADSDISAPVTSSINNSNQSNLYSELNSSYRDLPQNTVNANNGSDINPVFESDNLGAGDERRNIKFNNQPSTVSNTNKLEQDVIVNRQSKVIYHDKKLTTALVDDNPMIEELPNEALQNNYKQSNEQLLRDLRTMPIPERMHRIENIIAEQNNAHLDSKIRRLQDEIQALRGQLEAERHNLEKALAQQKLLYEDLDRRFSKVTPDAKLANASDHSSQTSTYLDNKHVQQDLYTEAYKNIRKRDYPKAIELFQQYINKYPNGTFGANANYWLGEVYMLQSDYGKALAAFDQVLIKYTKDPKSADAMYKKGLVYIYQKDFDKAKKTLAEVKEKYKNTTAARLADKQLQGIETITNDA